MEGSRDSDESPGAGSRAGGAGSGSESERTAEELELEHLPLPVLGARGAAGGVLMGLANLVPGISGGTMLLAVGVYPAFIAAVADATTLRWRPRTLLLLAAVGGAAVLAIGLLAGPVRALVVEHRWAMYSLFIGLTLGGVPLVWRMARPLSAPLAAGAAVAFAGMLVMQLGLGGGGAAGPSALLLALSGLAGASAMILPGVSGGYLLLLLGQYERILGAVDDLKRGLLASGGPDTALLAAGVEVAVPVGLGVGVGVVGVSNGLRWLLEHHPRPTLGALLGLLFGAVVGLWPFQQPVPPEPGDVLGGRTVTAENLDRFEPEDWRTATYVPDAGRAGSAAGLVVAGLALTLTLDRVGGGGASASARRREPAAGR